ncbi:MAG TPA: 2,3,4,5-tetrahydropyridine-2,6-dicarboxylate N-succinyltransferase [Candidatus Krumholzibacteria bacterium]|nr:2,3,4,5-tetrahydropyridine-2,6-dicarboxylate N-succinyltransferase [Candidatus Krumholzibacteria bacterium]
MMEETRRILLEAYEGQRDVAAPEVAAAFEALLAALEAGTVRAAAPAPDGTWLVQAWVKAGILVGFRAGKIVDMSVHPRLPFFDKHNLPTQSLDGVGRRLRLVPGGSSVRRGVHLGPDVVIMPPAYVNVGARVEEGSMVDSHALVGSCAQVGRFVHLSAAAQIGGVLEPPGARPVILEDGVLVGGNCGVYEGTLVRRRAVLGAGVILTASTPVYDLPRQQIIRPQPGSGLEIPEGAVVVPGSRALRGDFAAAAGLGLYTPVIVKYRDAQTDARTALEEALR